jgi:class 3 adenylate cyclase
MEQPWTAYVPRCVVEDFLAHPSDNPVGREQRFMAVVMFADISGFTALSEALGQAGRTGTEELTMLLNGYFAPMISLIQSYGGMIGKFGGDALTVLFRFTAETRIATIRRAISCALTMQAQMPHYANMRTSAGRFSLAIKIGLAEGPVLWTIIGDPALRLEYVFMGKVLTHAARAQTMAQRGTGWPEGRWAGDVCPYRISGR